MAALIIGLSLFAVSLGLFNFGISIYTLVRVLTLKPSINEGGEVLTKEISPPIPRQMYKPENDWGDGLDRLPDYEDEEEEFEI